MESLSYNPKNLPVFLGLFAENQKDATKKLEEYVISNLKYLQLNLKNSEWLSKEIDSFHNNYSSPKTIHITSLFIGGNKSKKKTEYFTSFKNDFKMTINLEALVYVPNKIICGICFQDDSLLKIENKIPHLTIKIGEWAPKNSNDVLKALFENKKSPFYEGYNKKFFGKEICEEVIDFPIDLGKQIVKTNVYIIRKDQGITIDGVTKGHF